MIPWLSGTMMIDTRWLPLGTLIDETVLPALRKSGPAATPCDSEALQGEQIDLQWEATQRWPVPPDRSDYDRVDAADFGDMESDPFVRKVMAQDVRMGWRVAHEH